MTRDWRQELEKHPKLVELKRRLSLKKRELKNDKEFVIETAKLRNALEAALLKYPKPAATFFRDFSDPTGMHRSKAREFLDGLRSRKLKLLLGRYLRYVARFGVVLRLKRGRPRFEEEYVIPWGIRFHVRLTEDHFEPVDGYPGDEDTPFEYFFESDKVETWPTLSKQMSLGRAKFVQIEDSERASIISRLEDFAYYPEGLTFIFHNADQPYLFCLVGEKVTNEIWRDASRVVSSFLRTHFNRGKAGRPRNLTRFRKEIMNRKKPGPLKAKLPGKEGTEKDFLSAQVYSARVGRAIR